MINTIYIEEAVQQHSRTREICDRYPHAKKVLCERYNNVFNSNSQNFRLQKKQPSLILAEKQKGRVLSTPPGYGIGIGENYYFSHMMNCLYDCRYCFLQGMYRSAHYVVFVNYEDFFSDITEISAKHRTPSWFFSGYDCDSLAMEPVTGFIEAALDYFHSLPQANLEIRTKSTQIRSLTNRDAISNCVVAYSFTPQDTAAQLEHKAPSVSKRIAALAKLQQQGWKIGLRFDPLIRTEKFADDYRKLFDDIFSVIEPGNVHSVSYGAFRLPKPFFKKMVSLYPQERLFATQLTENNATVSYEQTSEQYCLQTVEDLLVERIDRSVLYPCS